VMRATPQHTYQILTKRSLRLLRSADKLDWPSNVWMGVSIEGSSALYRVDHLRHVLAAVRFLSCEPLLGPLDGLKLDGIHWVIAGGESGPNYRPMDVQLGSRCPGRMWRFRRSVFLQAVGWSDTENAWARTGWKTLGRNACEGRQLVAVAG
jgi:protein gp37